MSSTMCTIRRIFSFLMLTIPLLSIAQQNPNPGIEVAKMQWQAKQVIPPSPEAAELGRYGNVPVSLFTGTPNVGIPLFELKGSSLSLPVSLSYNASGFKPEDAASWIGSGWALNAGGVITRSAMGNPDNEENYFGIPNILNPPTSNQVYDYYNFMLSIQNGVTQAQPDVYYYNFAGHTGKFLLNPDYSVFKKERDLTIINPCISNNCSSSNFTVVDEKGITYVFDKTETTHMVPNDDAGNPDPRTYDFISAWYLSSIVSADGNEVIEFEYHSPDNWQFLYSNLLPNQSVSYTYGDQISACCGIKHVNTDNSSLQTPPTVSMKRKFLKKITLKNFGTAISYVEIVSVAGQRDDSNFGDDRKVTSAEMYNIDNGINRLVKKYSFAYSYFGNTGATGPLAYLEKRLRLDNVQEIATAANTTSPPPHLFTYNNDWSKRFTADLDHWGFYNASGNTYLVPNTYFPTAADGGHPGRNVGLGANREASLNGSSASLLKKIQYPTGGYTTFDYELNYAKYADDINQGAVGGVRIKEIIDYSAQDKKAVAKLYTYTLEDGTTTSGKAGQFPEYKKITTYQHFPGIEPCGPNPDCEYNWSQVDYTLYTITMSTNSIYGLGSFQGSHIGYSRVTESQLDVGTGQPLGKTVYNYSTALSGENDDNIINGNLIKQSVFDNVNSLPLLETEFEYDYLGTDIIKGHIVKGEDLQTNKPNFCRYGTTHNYHNYTDNEDPPYGCSNIQRYETKLYLSTYTVQNQYKRLKKQITKIYDPLTNSNVITTKNLTYGNANHDFPTLLDETTSNGEKIKTSIKYVADYSGTANGPMASNIRQMQTLNMKGLPVEKLQYREDANGNNRRYISGQLTDYVYGQPVQIFSLEAQPLLTTVTPSSITSGSTMYYDPNYRLMGTMSYDIIGNLKEESKTNDVVTTYLWGYNNQYPVAKITGSNYATVIQVISQSQIDAVTATGNDNSVRSALDVLRTNPLTSSAFVSTYTYKPLIGISSATDPRGRIVYYEYDALNRLKLVRDHDNNIIKKICYNYAGQVENCLGVMYTNTPQSGNFTRNNCPPGYTGSTVTYTVPEGTYSSAISIPDANQLAINDVNANGQNYANTNGTCTAGTVYWNTLQFQYFTRNNCPQGYTGSSVQYTVPANTYSSTISIPAANQLALNDIAANGQNYANANGSCIPAECAYENCHALNEANQCIYGQCEMGIWVYIDTYYDSQLGQWVCVYHYEYSDGSWTAAFYSYGNSPCYPE